MSAPKTEKVHTDPDQVTPVEAEKVSDINLNNVGRYKKTTDEMGGDADKASTILAGNESQTPFEGLGGFLKSLGVDWSDGINTTADWISLGLVGLVALTGSRLIFPMKISR